MDDAQDDYEALKRRLLGRIVFAVVVLAGLLASLAVFDRINAPAPAPAPVAPSSTPKAPAAVPAPPVDLIKSVEAGKEEKPADPAPTAPAVAEGSASPGGMAPPVASAGKPLTAPATGRHALMRPIETPVAGKHEPPGRAQPAPAQVVPMPPTPIRPLAATPERPFAVQLGVFSDVANAEDLRARLEKAGIKATIEARVQIGPFATRAEADAARAKLREIGMPEGLVLSLKGRR